MKKLIVVLLFIFSINSFSQDTSIVSYYPMSVGNVWVYTWTSPLIFGGCYSIVRKKIFSSVVLNSKTYFIFQTEIRIISGSGNCYGNGMDTLRIDSVSGNILRYSANGNCYLPHDYVIDSLRMHKHDTLKTCGTIGYVCTDTNIVTIIGVSRKGKNFGIFYVDSGADYGYVQGIGYSGYSSYGQAGSSNLTLRGCVINGVVHGDTSYLVGINQISSEVLKSFSLSQNYPNPFNPNTKIKFQIAKLGNAKLTVYDALGKEVVTLVNEQLQPGTYEVEWDAGNYPSGVYFYKLETDRYTVTKKLVLIK
jgi:hypothetical protein